MTVMQDVERIWSNATAIQHPLRTPVLPACRVEGGMSSREYPADPLRVAPVPIGRGPLVQPCSGGPGAP